MTPNRKRKLEDADNGIDVRLSSPKKSKRRVSLVGGDPLAPSLKKWNKMRPFQSFLVADKHGQGHRFPIKRYALFLPEGARPGLPIPLRDYWVGKIKEIKSRNNDSADVWVKVQWLWSVHDILKAEKAIDPRPYGDMERILSSHFDFVAANCIDDFANVESYVESDPEPPAISDKTFYYRSTFNIRTGIIRSIPQSTCFCNKAYNANETGVMHFCPRKECCHAYHASCLKRSDFVDKSQEDLQKVRSRRALAFELAIPSTSDDEEEEEEFSSVSGSITLLSPNMNTSLHDVDDKRHQLPSELLALARSPIVKGIGTGLPEEWGCVTGNFAPVTRARKLLHDALTHKNSQLPVRWRTLLELPGQEGVNDENIDARKVQAWSVEDTDFFICPNCKGVI